LMGEFEQVSFPPPTGDWDAATRPLVASSSTPDSISALH